MNYRMVLLGWLSIVPSLATLVWADPPTTVDVPRGDTVTFESLVSEMVDRDALARWPSPEYQQRQASSYNRRSVAPDKPGWFADQDGVGFIRTEKREGKTEWVLMEHDGPGCITRIWTPFFYYNFNERTGPNIRVYLDGAEKPVIDCSLIELVQAKQFVGEPFSAHTARAGDLYLPIPYAKSCIITMRQKPFYNIINYRSYPTGTTVETFTKQVFKDATAKLAEVGKQLLKPSLSSEKNTKTLSQTIKPNGTMDIPLPEGSAAIRYLEFQLTPEDDAAGYLRSTILSGSFDGEQTVWCPLGDFFGCPDAIHSFQTLHRQVNKDDVMICRWVMPYEKSAELKILNLADKPIKVRVRVVTGSWQWDDRSMHFHASWRPDDVAQGSEFQDWNFIKVAGQGVFVGDQWTVLNPSGGWWGEGDEKIYIDHDKDNNFPSHFGTGTEDYYGWAGGRTPTRKDEFSHPFLANVRVGGLDGRTRGFNICVRQRGLDAIPFRQKFQFDMESSFGTSIRKPWNLLSYSAVTWWYARPGAKSNLPPLPEAASKPMLTLAKLEQQAQLIRSGKARSIAGAIEFESLNPTAQSKELRSTQQVPADSFQPQRLSGGAHYFVAGRQIGDFVEFTLAEQYKPRKATLHLVRSYDFGTVQVSVNGKPVGKPIDLYEADAVTIKKVELGNIKPDGNVIRLRVELVGKNPKSRGTASFFGLDCIELK